MKKKKGSVKVVAWTNGTISIYLIFFRYSLLEMGDGDKRGVSKLVKISL